MPNDYRRELPQATQDKAMHQDSELTPDFIERQRKQLEALRDQLLHTANQSEAEERNLSQRHRGEVQDAGDEGAIEAHRATIDVVSAQSTSRLQDVLRALEKMEDGSYGLSDDSGEPIGRERLEAVPEARFTVDEEAERDRMPDLPGNG